MDYREIEQLCEEQIVFPVFAVSREGENITIEKGYDEGGDFFLVTNLRRDGWHVMHKYYRNEVSEI